MSRLGHVPALDGIRGVMVLAVISFHYYGYPTGAYCGMEVFFALSGFLITSLLLEERDRTGTVSLGGFYRRRGYRLLPALFTVLAAYVIATSASSRALEQIGVGGLYGANIVMASGSHFLYGTPLSPFWSLAQEEQFYLLWPLLLVFLLRRGVREGQIARWLVCALIALAVYRAALGMTGASEIRIYCGPDTHADALVLGCFLALVRRRGFRVPQFAGWFCLAALFAAYAFLAPTHAAVAYGELPVSIGAVLLVGALLEVGMLSRALSLRLFVWLGSISYSLYLWHLFMFWLLGWHGQVMALVLTLVAATLSYYKVEKPLRTAYRRRTAAQQGRLADAPHGQSVPSPA